MSRSEPSSLSADIFNGTLAAAAVAALFELGFLDELKRLGRVRLREFAGARGLHRQSVEALVQTLRCFGVLGGEGERDTVEPGPHFAEVYRDKGYFLWLFRGYGAMLRNLATIVRQENRTGNYIERDGKYIALAGRDYGAQFVDRPFAAVLREEPFQVAADLGCGSAERLLRLAREDPEFRGIGVDVNGDSLALAKEAVIAENLQDRITLVHADVRQLEPQPEFEPVEVVFSFFMGHDLWPRANCLHALRRIYRAFPRARRFLLCDTYRSDLPPDQKPPVFTLGFEVTHALMGQYVPSLQEWLDLFAETPWQCVARHEIGIPFSCIFDLRRREEA